MMHGQKNIKSIKSVYHTGFWWENLMERHHLEELGGGGGKKTKMDLQELGWGGWIVLVKDRGRAVGACECGNEPTGSEKCEEFCSTM